MCESVDRSTFCVKRGSASYEKCTSANTFAIISMAKFALNTCNSVCAKNH